MGKKTKLPSPHYLMGPAGIKWATTSTGRRDSAVGATVKIRGSPLYAKAYSMADVLKTSIYCMVSAFHGEMLNSENLPFPPQSNLPLPLQQLVAEFYTFLETTLVTLSLLPHFIAFFSDKEIPGTPGNLATTFLAFGKVKSSCVSMLQPPPSPIPFFPVTWHVAFYLAHDFSMFHSIELGICFERFGISGNAHIIGGCQYHNH
ncbi:uncharacterized protein Fot_09376 [Forsythia ovata]|uniref:Uncharacterized protein n=1 Tax=Forsythia ovata TaxID=205694 RepID=A0ABD1WDT8_9LAMI